MRTILEPWDVDSVTYANSFGGDGVASESGPVVSTIASPGSDETFVVSVHSIVQGWVDGANHGLSITPNGGPFWQDGFGIWSSEEPVAASRPSLDAWLLPQGLASFADSVVSFEPGDGTNGNDDPLKALGPANEGDSVSLGDGGTIVLEFTDNVLTGSSTSDPDLWIYEIGLGGFGGTGSADESVFVSVSSDGSTWHEVGTAKGGSDAIDLDASGFGPGDAFSFVRLVDDGIDGSCSCSTPGADITAIAGIETSAFSTLTESGTPVATLFDAPHLGGAVFEDTGSYELSLVGGNGQPEAPLVLYYSPLLFPAPVPALGVDFLVPPTFDPIPAVNEGHGAFYFAAPIPASIVGFDLHFQAFFIEDLVGPALSSSNAATLSW